VISLLLTALPPISTASVRTVRFVKAADDVNLTDVYGITRRFTAKATGWSVKETRQFRYSLIGTDRVEGKFKPVIAEYSLPLTTHIVSETDEMPSPLNDRLARIYSALVMAKGATFPAEPGGLGQVSVEISYLSASKFKFRYREYKFDATGEGERDAATSLPRRWSLAAKDVAIPGGDGRADLTLSEVPETP